MSIDIAVLQQALSLLQERDTVVAAIGKSSVSLGPNKGYTEGEGLLGSLGQLTGRKRWAMAALAGTNPAAKARLTQQAKDNERPFRVEVMRLIGNTETELKAVTATLKEARAQLLDTEKQLSFLQQQHPELKHMTMEDIQSNIDLELATGEEQTTSDNVQTRLAIEASNQMEADQEVEAYLNNNS